MAKPMIDELMADDPEELWSDTVSYTRDYASEEECARVRLWYMRHITERITESDGHNTIRRWHAERTEFAAEIQRLCDRNQHLRRPGGAPQVRGRTPDEAEEARIDAGRTPQRHLKAGMRILHWQLTLIECVLCEREGMAMPADFYNAQQTLL